MTLMQNCENKKLLSPCRLSSCLRRVLKHKRCPESSDSREMVSKKRLEMDSLCKIN